MPDTHDSHWEPRPTDMQAEDPRLRELDEPLAAELIDAENGRRLPVRIQALGGRGAQLRLREERQESAQPDRLLLEFRAGPRGPLLLLPCRGGAPGHAEAASLEVAFLLDGEAPLRFTLEALDAFLAAPSHRLRKAG